MEPKPTYTTAGDVQFYVKATSNCEPLGLTTLQALFGGEWSTLGFRSSAVLIKTGPDLTPRLVVGWTDLYGGMATSCTVYERIGEHDEPAWAIVGGNSGLRILANMEEHGDFEDEHLPPGWGTPVLLIEDADDIVDEALRKALNLDSGQPLYEPPDWSADDDEPELDFDDLAAIDETLATYRELLAAQPWLRRWYSTSETAEALRLDYDTTLAMIAGGVIRAERENQKAQWRVAVAEVERWRRILRGVTP